MDTAHELLRLKHAIDAVVKTATECVQDRGNPDGPSDRLIAVSITLATEWKKSQIDLILLYKCAKEAMDVAFPMIRLMPFQRRDGYALAIREYYDTAMLELAGLL